MIEIVIDLKLRSYVKGHHRVSASVSIVADSELGSSQGSWSLDLGTGISYLVRNIFKRVIRELLAVLVI